MQIIIVSLNFHRFPNDEKLTKHWVSNIIKLNKQVAVNICTSSTICSDHFEENCFKKPIEENSLLITYPKLKLGSLPTSFPNLDPLQT